MVGLRRLRGNESRPFAELLDSGVSTPWVQLAYEPVDVGDGAGGGDLFGEVECLVADRAGLVDVVGEDV